MKLQRAKGWSTLSAISPTIKLILDMLPEPCQDNDYNTSVLDVGCGEGIYGMILSSVVNITIDGVDVYKGKNVEHIYDSFYQQSILDFAYDYYYDVTIALHVLEHLKMEDAIKVVNTMQENSDAIIVGLPNSRKGHVYKQTDNPHSHKWGIHNFPFEEVGLELVDEKFHLYSWHL